MPLFRSHMGYEYRGVGFIDRFATTFSLLTFSSLIAIMLGRLRMSVPQALSVYREFGESIFGRKQKRALNGLNFLAARYKHANVTRVINGIVSKHCKEHTTGSCNEDTMFWNVSSAENRHVSENHHVPENHRVPENDPVEYWHLCQAYVLSEKGHVPQLNFARACVTARVDGKCLITLPLRTYRYFHHTTIPDTFLAVEEDDFLIREAGRATSAVPFYFKILERRKGGMLRKYIDGGILLNNPSRRMLVETKNRCAWRNSEEKKDPAVLLSVGTGVPGNPFSQPTRVDLPFWNSFMQKVAVGRHVLMRYTGSEDIHESLRDEVNGEHKYYKRLNVDQGLGDIKFDDWRTGQWNDERRSGGETLTKMEDAVRRYIGRNTLNTDIELHLLPKTLIEHTAERLVRHRTERARLATMNVHSRDRWYHYRGRYISGNLANDWNVESGDQPWERRT